MSESLKGTWTRAGLNYGGFQSSGKSPVLPRYYQVTKSLQKARAQKEQVHSAPYTIGPENFRKQLLRTVVALHWPLNTPDKMEFQRLIDCCNPKQNLLLKVPSSSTLTRDLAEERKRVDKEVKESLPAAPQKVALVLDYWSAQHQEGYIYVKSYWITEGFELREGLLGFEPVSARHDGASLGMVVFGLINKFELIGRIVAITSDNASNNDTLTKALNEALEWLYERLHLGQKKEIFRVPCLCHVLQLCVNELLVKLRVKATNDQVKKNWNKEEEEQALRIRYKQGNVKVDEVLISYFGSTLVVRLSANWLKRFQEQSPKSVYLLSKSTRARNNGLSLKSSKKRLI